MKRFLIVILLLSNLYSNAQITFERSYPTVSQQYGIFFITNIGYDNYKYVLHDCYSDQVNLYNLDHSPFLNIQIPITSDTCTRFSIGFITSTLFDCDSSTIEYALLPEQAIYPFRIYRTDGTLLFSKDSVYGWWCYGCQEASTEIKTIVNTPLGAKMYLHYPWGPGDDSVLVYSLCGTLPENITEINQSDSYVKVFPNPSTHQINFLIKAPGNFEKYNLIIFNSAMQMIKTVEIQNINSQVNLDAGFMEAGMYFYSLKSKTKVFHAGKFVLAK